MDEEDGGRRLAHHRDEDFAGVDDAGGQTPFGDLHIADEPVLVVEEDGDEALPLEVAQAFVVVAEDLARRGEEHPRRQGGVAKTPAEMEDRLQFGRLGRADPLDLAEFGDARLGQGAQAAETSQKMAGVIESITVAGGIAGTEDEGKKFGVAEGLRPRRQELFPGTLRFRPVFDSLHIPLQSKKGRDAKGAPLPFSLIFRWSGDYSRTKMSISVSCTIAIRWAYSDSIRAKWFSVSLARRSKTARTAGSTMWLAVR